MTHTPSPTGADSILRLLDRPVTGADLAANADQVARPAESERGRTMGLMVFRFGDDRCALGATLLRRVTPVARPRSIPHRSSGVIRGLCNIRGELVLCADLRRLLGLRAHEAEAASPDARSDPRRMVVIGAADDSWAFEVDGVIGVEAVDLSTLRPPPLTVEHALGACTMGVTELDGHTVTVLDGERILTGFRAGLA